MPTKLLSIYQRTKANFSCSPFSVHLPCGSLSGKRYLPLRRLPRLMQIFLQPKNKFAQVKLFLLITECKQKKFRMLSSILLNFIAYENIAK